MADNAADTSAIAPETPAVEAPPTQPAEGSTAEATKEGEVQQVDPAVNDAENERLKFAESYHRKRLGEIGNTVAKVNPEVRKKLAANPTLIEEQEAEIAALRRIAASGGNVGPTNAAVKPPQVDDAEADAKEFLASEGWDGTEEGYKAMLKHDTGRIRFMEKRMAKKQPSFDPEKATTEVAGKLTERQIQEELTEVYNSPEWNDEEKGAEFEGHFRRLAQKAVNEGKRFSPSKVAEEARKKVFQPAAVVAKPKPKISLGDQSSGKVSANAESDPLDDYNKRLRAKGVDPNTW